MEFQRRTTSDIDEILYWLTSSVVSEIARDYEVRNRNTSQDSRRIWFAKHEELMSSLFAQWGDRSRHEHQDTLKRFPFNDSNPMTPDPRDSTSPERMNWHRILRKCVLMTLLFAVALSAKPLT